MDHGRRKSESGLPGEKRNATYARPRLCFGRSPGGRAATAGALAAAVRGVSRFPRPRRNCCGRTTEQLHFARRSAAFGVGRRPSRRWNGRRHGISAARSAHFHGRRGGTPQDAQSRRGIGAATTEPRATSRPRCHFSRVERKGSGAVARRHLEWKNRSLHRTHSPHPGRRQTSAVFVAGDRTDHTNHRSSRPRVRRKARRLPF